MPFSPLTIFVDAAGTCHDAALGKGVARLRKASPQERLRVLMLYHVCSLLLCGLELVVVFVKAPTLRLTRRV